MDFFSGAPLPSMRLSQGEDFMPDPEELARMLREMPPDPQNPMRPRPSTDVLKSRKDRLLKFWRPRNLRMIKDEKMYKLQNPVEDRLGGDEVGASEVLVMNDPYVLVEKTANMIAATEPNHSCISQDPGMKDTAQKVKDFTYWWRDEAERRWVSNLNNTLTRDEIYYLALRGWVAGRVMLDPGDPDFPYRYDIVDPLHVYPQRGPKGLRYVFHVYKDSKINVLNDLGWDNDLLTRIEEHLADVSDEADVEVAAYFDDVWHVLFVDDEEVWSAAHNYGFVPWAINISFGPPIRRTDPRYGAVTSGGSTDALNRGVRSWGQGGGEDYTAWWGVSVFQGIKDVYNKLNKLASAVMTEAMKAPNPPAVVYTNKAGEVEGKRIDTAIGATNHLLYGQEDFKLVEYGFKPSELAPLMQLLIDARNRGALPAVMYGEGANYLSGFAVSLLQAGSRDIILPLIKSHEHYLMTIFYNVLKMTAEIYPFPINMVETDPQTGARQSLTTITSDEIKLVGYNVKVKYGNIFPQDKWQQAQMAALLVDKKLIDLDSARGEEFLGMRNPGLINKKVLGDLAWFNPTVVESAIPLALLEVDPVMYLLYTQAKAEEARKEFEMAQMAMMTGAPPGGPPGKPPAGPGGPEGEGIPQAEPPSANPTNPTRPQKASQIGGAPF